MLTSQSYFGAFVLYIMAALIAIWLFSRWLPGSWPRGLRWAIYGLLAGLLLTPALPSESATTLAPALIVVVFNALFGEGWASAVPAAAVLLVAMAGGCVLGGLLGLVSARLMKPRADEVTPAN